MEKVQEILFSEESERAVRFYKKLLMWLNNPVRAKYNDPVKLVSNAGIIKGQTVLEIGCGSGFFTEELSNAVGEEGTVFATDIHPMAVREMEQRIKNYQLSNVLVQREDAMNTTFNPDMFDLIVLYGVIPAPVITAERLSKEMYRILKPGGVCAIWTAIPLWTPSEIERFAKFSRLKRNGPVFRLRKEI